jgi:hypothetical protein
VAEMRVTVDVVWERKVVMLPFERRAVALNGIIR